MVRIMVLFNDKSRGAGASYEYKITKVLDLFHKPHIKHLRYVFRDIVIDKLVKLIKYKYKYRWNNKYKKYNKKYTNII